LHGVPKSACESVSLKPVAGRLMFRIKPPSYVTPEIVSYVRAKLTRAALAQQPRLSF
jgi:hypothetical protein